MGGLSLQQLRQTNTRTEDSGARYLVRLSETEVALGDLVNKGYCHWIVMFSGGKDSTATMITALEASRKLGVQRIDVVYADTLIEIPTIRQYAVDFLKHLQEFDRLNGLPVCHHVVHPSIENRFWVYMLGKGYPPPHQKFRWCTRRLKVEPVQKVLKGVTTPGSTVILTGVRYGESQDRDVRLRQTCSRGGECGQGVWLDYRNKLQTAYCAPIVDWNECDVWDFLEFHAPDLGYPTAHLEQSIYGGRETRFGCWMCTVVRQDKAMERTIARPEWRHLAPLAEFRTYVWEVTRNSKTREPRPDGRPGRLTCEVRKALLERLLIVQKEAGLELISDDEIQYIQEMWRNQQ